jgi:hypothetical protein
VGSAAVIGRIAALAGLLSVCIHAQVQVQFKADSPTDPQWARIDVKLTNLGTTAISAPKAEFDLAIPSGKIPVVESWSVGTVAASLEQKSDGSWSLWLSLPGSLAAGQEWNAGQGIQVGVHLSDWSNWQPWTSPSFAGNTGSWAIDQAILVWDATGRQIWGTGSTTGPVASTTGTSTIQVGVGTGGSCNVVGSVVLVAGDHLDLRCQEQQPYSPAQIWIDGALHGGSDSATILPDGRDHQVAVQFAQRLALWSTISTQGSGACSPSPTALTYQGDSLWVACAAGDKARLATVEVNGVQTSPSPRYGIGNLQAAAAVNAVFVPTLLPNANLSVQALRDTMASAAFSAFRLQVKNGGTASIPAGWKVRIPFRVPKYSTPVINTWDVPNASTSLTSYGEGWYVLTLVSTETLAPGAIGGAGRGWYLALSLSQTSSNWDRTGDVALPSKMVWTSVPYIRVIAADGNPLAGQEYLMSSAALSHPVVQVLYKDDGATTNILRPRIVLQNLGPGALSDFVYDFFFCTEGGKVPVIEPWYGVPSVHIEALGGFCYKVRYNFLGVTVPPGGSIPDFTGTIIGLHYSDWSTWDRSNDWSHTNSTQTLVADPNIPVYDRWGNLISGNEWTSPGAPGYSGGDAGSLIATKVVPPIIVAQPRDTTVSEGAGASFEVRAAGDGALTYQWRCNGQDLVGATYPVLKIDQTRAEMNGNRYLCKVSGPSGWVLSREAVLTVQRKPVDLVIQIQPVDDTVALGAQGRFEVYATGPEVLSYQWYRDAYPIKGAGMSRVAVPVASERDTESVYWVRVTDGLGRTKDSRQVHLHLRAPGSANMGIVVAGSFQTGAGSVPTDTTVDLKVRIFASKTAGSVLWSEDHWDVPVIGGKWDLVVGSSSARTGLLQTVASHSTLYLEVVLDGSSPRSFEPRIPLTAAPFALQSGGRIQLGTGVPTTRTDLDYGTLYLDQSTGRTWFRDASGWRPIDS